MNSDSKESTCNPGDLGLIPGSGRPPGEWEWLPTPGFLPGEFHGQRSMVSLSPWGHKELDTTEQLSLNITDLIWRLPLPLTIPLASYSLSQSLSFLIYIMGIKVFTSWDPKKQQTLGR